MNLYDSRILLVDDNIELADMVHDMLRRNGYANVSCAHTCEEAMRVFRGESPQLVILDIMLPDGDGFTLFRRIRDISDVPILFLSAKDEDNDRLFGLGLGADDYITKPFLSQELLLRVNVVLKRTYFPSTRMPYSSGGNVPGGSVNRSGDPHFPDSGFSPSAPGEPDVLILGEHRISFAEASVTFRGKTTSFTAKELQLLRKLAQNRGNIVTFDALCMAVWGDSYYGYENTLMVHIRHIREKIEDDPSSPKWLLTVRGLGYRLKKEEKTDEKPV